MPPTRADVHMSKDIVVHYKVHVYAQVKHIYKLTAHCATLKGRAMDDDDDFVVFTLNWKEE